MNSEKQNLRPVFADQVNTMVNLLKPYMPSTETYKNSDGGAVRPTRNSDGSISLSGETLDAGITIKAGTAYLRTDKSYCLCGTPGQGVKLQIIIDGKTYIDNGTGATFSVRSGGYFDVNVVINPHTQIDKLTIYPIVTRNMQAKFGDFVPYISDTDQLNTQVADLSACLTQGAGAHNAIYRGKNLGTSVTTAQYNAITAGTFDDLYIGDYWVINGKTWRIAAFDYFLHSGDTECTTHHAVIVPDECLYDAQMNTKNDTTGGYAAVKNRGVLTDAETVIKAAFGASHILSHRVYLTTAVANGKPSGGAWVDTICDLMNEEMVYGTGIFRPTSDGSTVPVNHRVEKSQLPLFAHEPSRITTREYYWLRDVVSATYFADVYASGLANFGNASATNGVRPAFCIS